MHETYNVENYTNSEPLMEESEKLLVEATSAELLAPSGIFENDKELSNIEAIDFIGKAMGAYLVYTNCNGGLSSEASRHNSMVTRSGEGEYLLAVVAKFPPTSTS